MATIRGVKELRDSIHSAARSLVPVHETAFRLFCAKCQKPVEWWSVSLNPMTENQEWTVRCHGETERAAIPRYMIEDGGKIVEANCFVPLAQIGALNA